MRTGRTILSAIDVHRSFSEIDLIPPQAHQLADSHTVTKAHQNQSRVTVPVPTGLSGGRHELIDLSLSEVFPRPAVRILDPNRGNFPVYGVWGAAGHDR
jgi:hypothetical protein